MAAQRRAPTAVIFTTASTEHEVIASHITNIREEVHPRGTIYTRGIFATPGGFWNIAIVEIASGNPGASFEVERAVGHFMPELILFIDIAQGFNGVMPGDVVAATKIYNYESGRIRAQFEPIPVLWSSTYRMEQRARAEARKHDWLRRLDGSNAGQVPHVIVAPMVAGEKKSISVTSDLWNMITTIYSDACAMDTEGYGFLQAAHANQQVEALVIRGISDVIEDPTPYTASTRLLAAQHASAFAFEVLAKLDVHRTEQPATEPAKVTISETIVAPPVVNNQTVTLYYAYANEDLGLLTQFQKQLSTLKRNGLISVWYRAILQYGEDIEVECQKHLEHADIILLFISPYFVASESIYDEAVRAMQRHKTQRTVVIPIIGRPTADWRHTDFGKLLPLPQSGKALSEFSGPLREKQLAEVVTVIRKIVEDLRSKKN